MLRFRTADMGDVHTVLADLSEISAAEVIAECGSWWNALPKVAKLLTLTDSQTEALVDETGTALAIFGHYPSKYPGNRTTWFVFSRGFEARGLAATLACRRRGQALQAVYLDTHFYSHTRSSHPFRDRWFRLLGFDYFGVNYGGRKDGAHCYVLLESDKTSDLGTDGRYNPEHPRAS